MKIEWKLIYEVYFQNPNHETQQKIWEKPELRTTKIRKTCFVNSESREHALGSESESPATVTVVKGGEMRVRERRRRARRVDVKTVDTG